MSIWAYPGRNGRGMTRKGARRHPLQRAVARWRGSRRHMIDTMPPYLVNRSITGQIWGVNGGYDM